MNTKPLEFYLLIHCGIRENNSREDHWRLQFSRKLEALTIGDLACFEASVGGRLEGSSIHLVSALIVCALSQWSEGADIQLMFILAPERLQKPLRSRVL